MLKLFRFLRPYWWQILILLAATGLQVYTTLRLPALMADIINDGIVKEDVGMIWLVGGKMILFAIISALISTLIASFTSYIVHRTDSPLRKTLDSFAQLPSAIPGTLLGLSILTAAEKIHFENSTFLIVLAMTIAFLPFSYRIVTQSYSLLKPTLDDGARSLGANQFYTFTSIIFPLSIGGIFSGFIYAFIRGAGTLSAVIFLVSFNTPLASISIVNLAEQGDWGKSASLALILTIITFSVLAFGTLILKAFLKNNTVSGEQNAAART